VFDPVEVLALYLGALGHDAGHFRLNNAFLKNSKHALYKKYRESVLENFHLGLLFELLEDEDVGIVAFLEEKDKERFRNLITTLILATDMAKHMGLFKQLQAFLNDARAKHRELTWMHESMRSDGAASRDESDEERANRSYGEEGASSRDATPRSSANLDRADVDLDADENARTHESWVRPSIDGADAEQRVLVMQLLLKCAGNRRRLGQAHHGGVLPARRERTHARFAVDHLPQPQELRLHLRQAPERVFGERRAAAVRRLHVAVRL
jgi:cAMP-specific phosphodiesterase 4